jgi:hypothetical protein
MRCACASPAAGASGLSHAGHPELRPSASRDRSLDAGVAVFPRKRSDCGAGGLPNRDIQRHIKAVNEYMFDALNKYKHAGHFSFSPSSNLRRVCNAPTDKSGVYVVYASKSDHKELVYIGCSGKVLDRILYIRKAGLGGIKDRLVNGKQFGEPRHCSWKRQMRHDKIEELDIYWYVTHNDEFVDCPRVLENKLLKIFMSTYGRLPSWNLEL